MGGGLAADGILLIVEDEVNVSGPAEMLGGSVPKEEEVPDEEHQIHERTLFDRRAVASTLCLFVGSQAEVEANGHQVSDVVGYGVGRGSCLGDDGVHDSKKGGLSSLDRGSSRP